MDVQTKYIPSQILSWLFENENWQIIKCIWKVQLLWVSDGLSLLPGSCGRKEKIDSYVLSFDLYMCSHTGTNVRKFYWVVDLGCPRDSPNIALALRCLSEESEGTLHTNSEELSWIWPENLFPKLWLSLVLEGDIQGTKEGKPSLVLPSSDACEPQRCTAWQGIPRSAIGIHILAVVNS